MNAPVSVLEHQDLMIGMLPSATTLTIDEADRLCDINDFRTGFCARGHRRMRFAQHAGVVSIGARTLEVLPKVGEGVMPADECRGILLRLLGLAENIKIAKLKSATQGMRDASLIEVFIASFFDEVTLLLRGGLLRRYRAFEEDLPLVRGRVLIGRQIATNALRVDRVACRYDEFTADNDWNRVLRAALRVTRPWLRSMSLRRRWIELWPAFEDVADVTRLEEVFDRLSPDRQVARYEASVQWARWIVATLSPSLRAGKAMAPGLLFDTNQLFERAVARHLRHKLAMLGAPYTLRTQVGGNHLAKTVSTPAHDVIGLKPDFVLLHGDRPVLIGDTKWKRLSVSPSGHLDPANRDVHQMLAYAAAFGCEHVALIYPWHEGLKNARETEFELPRVAGIRARVHIVVLDVGTDGLPMRRGCSAPILGAALA